jgi:Predicted metal-dependent hydrolase of the TIM-barrel fold
MTPPRIDAHQHFWRYDPAEYGWIDDAMAGLRRDYLPDEALREMTGAGVDACVAVQARQALDETRWLLALADAHPAIVGVVGWIDLQSTDARKQLGLFADHQKLVGIRHIVQSEPDDRFMLRPAFCGGIALLEEFGLAYDILVYSRHLAVAVELAERFASQRFVLDHLGKPDIRHGERRAWEKSLRRLAGCSNVSAKLSGLVTEADWSLDSAGHPTVSRRRLRLLRRGRLMLGSDWPVCTVAADYARVVSLVTDYLADRPAEERDAVLGGNAQRFYNLT